MMHRIIEFDDMITPLSQPMMMRSDSALIGIIDMIMLAE